MSKKNNRKTAAARIADAKRVELEAVRKKLARRARREDAAAWASGEMAVDGGGGKRRAVRGRGRDDGVAASLRATGGVGKKRVGKNTHKVVRGVNIGKVKLRKNAVVRGIKIVDAATKQAAIDAIAEERGTGPVGM